MTVRLWDCRKSKLGAVEVALNYLLPSRERLNLGCCWHNRSDMVGEPALKKGVNMLESDGNRSLEEDMPADEDSTDGLEVL